MAMDATDRRDENADARGMERRRYPRHPGPFDARQPGVATPLQIVDLSPGGCFVQSLHEQRIGTILNMRISFAADIAVSVTAQVLYRKPASGFAVQFIETDEETMARLAQGLKQADGGAVSS